MSDLKKNRSFNLLYLRNIPHYYKIHTNLTLTDQKVIPSQ